MDRRSSRRAWIGVLLAVLGSEFQIDAVLGSEFQIDAVLGSEFQMEISTWIGVSNRRRAPCLDRNFREFGMERSENVGIESSFREDSRTESREWRERV